MAITEREAEQIKKANASGRPVVVFIHGLWLLARSWDRWREVFEAAGYATVAPSWPDDPETVVQARADPSVFAGKTVTDVGRHVVEVMSELTAERAIVGHSVGGLLAQIIAGLGYSQATVAIDPAPFRGVRRLTMSALHSARPVLANPINYGRELTLTFEQFRYGWANAVGEEEARRLHDEFHVAAPGAPVFQVALANLNPVSRTAVDTKNPRRGPLLLISGGEDHATPPAMTNAAFKLQRRNRGVTEIVELADRGHSLTIDNDWREVAEAALAFIKRFL
jgi:pimeloyl-ACP methyl ester carboxylesterase